MATATVSFGVIGFTGEQPRSVNHTIVHSTVVGTRTYGRMRNVSSSPELPHFVTRRRSSAV